MTINKPPLSPHLQVYRLPMLALLSIVHRGTGLFLSAGAVLLPVVLIALASGPEMYACVHRILAAWYGQILLFLLSASLIYHLLNGLRHLIWDLGFNLEVKQAETSGIVLLVLTVVLTAAIWWLACWQRYGGNL